METDIRSYSDVLEELGMDVDVEGLCEIAWTKFILLDVIKTFECAVKRNIRPRLEPREKQRLKNLLVATFLHEI